jgi:dTMP kinase
MAKSGLFISVEGIDGAGKSTHVEFIRQYLEGQGHKVVVTREPGGTELGEKVRDLLLNSESMHEVTELLLMFASRQELIDKVIRPYLAQGVCVIADRFIDASTAYQGFGRGIGVDKINMLIKLLEPSLSTNLTFLFDAPLELAYARVEKHQAKDRIEQEEAEFFSRVLNGYYSVAKSEPSRVKIVCTDRDKELTRAEIAKHLDELISKY